MPHAKYYDHSAITPLEFFWDAEHEPYPQTVDFMRPDDIDYEKIDVGLRDLVRKINATDWAETIMCCEGHPERDAAGIAHIEIWIRIKRAYGFQSLLNWIDGAVRYRKRSSMSLADERLIYLEYLGLTPFGWYFVIYSQFVSIPENKRILVALKETWQP